MCTYTLNIDDKLVNRVKPSFKNEKAFQKWLQSQVEVLFIQYATNIDNAIIAVNPSICIPYCMFSFKGFFLDFN